MNYPYSNQEKAKKQFLRKDEYIMFGLKAEHGKSAAVDTGTVVAVANGKVEIEIEDNNGNFVTEKFCLDDLVLFRDKEWKDIK